jgi:hypothetical protein
MGLSDRYFLSLKNLSHMHTTLLLLLATRRLIRQALATTLGVALVLAASVAEAQTIYGLGTVTVNFTSPFPPFPSYTTGQQGLVLINSVTGTAPPINTPITGVTAGQTLIGIDYRPANGLLYALGYDAGASSVQLYTINPATSVATPVAAAFSLNLGTATDRIGFDFNPVADRIRVVSTTNANIRLNPITGGIAATDTNLDYIVGDPNDALDPGIGAVAYTNSFAGTTTTTLYDFDELNNGVLSTQNPPNNGSLNTVATVTFNGFGVGSPRAIDLDIYYNAGVPQNEAFVTEVTAGGSSNFYRMSLTTGAATLLGNTVPSVVPFEIRDIAAAPAAALTGQLLYAISGTQLISFDSDSPGTIRSTVSMGAPDAGQTIVGMDFRPATGELYALGYNSSNNDARLYIVNRGTGAVSAIGAGPVALLLGGASERIGFDFNPTVDRIRVVSTNRADYRLVPTTGAIAATDGLLTAGPVISGAAYTNSQSNANTTTLYDYDATNAQLYIQNPPNNGTLVAVGGSGLTPPATPDGSDFDIFNTPGTTTNTAFLAVNAGASTDDNLYTVNLTTGAATLKGLIGTGGNVTGLAAYIAVGTGLTWNGSSSSDWGTAANWTPNQVPTASNDVTIPGGTPNNPTVSNAQQARAVTLTTSAVLTTANGGTLTVGGNFTNNGGSVAGSGTGVIILNGVAAQTLGGTSLSTFNNLTVGTAGATTGGPAAVQRGLVLNGNLTVGVGQAFTLLSNATGTAYVVNSTGTVSGTVVVQRFINPSLNAGLGYRHYSTPVGGPGAATGSSVSDLATAGYTPVVNSGYNSTTTPSTVTPYPNIYFYDETRLTTSVATGIPEFDKGWASPTTTGDALEVGRGYTVNIGAASVVDFSGTLNNGNYTRGGLSRGPQATAGWQFLGNPYPAPIDWTQVVANGTTNIDNAVYVFKSSGQYGGSYAAYVNGVGTNGGTNVLPVAQGYFVRVSGAGQTGSVTMENADRLTTADPTPFQRDATHLPLLKLALSNASAATQTAVYFQPGATAGADAAFDAYALPNLNGLVLATEVGSEALSINGLPLLTGVDAVLPLQIGAAGSGTYTLQVEALRNLPGTYHAYLRDALTGTYTDLATTATISLTLAANAPAAGRYSLVFSPQNRVLATTSQELAQLVSVYPNPAHATATLLLPLALRGHQATPVQVLDNLGRVVLSSTLAAGTTQTLELPLGSLAPGVYSVQARTSLGTVTRRLVVE